MYNALIEAIDKKLLVQPVLGNWFTIESEDFAEIQKAYLELIEKNKHQPDFLFKLHVSFTSVG